MNFREILHNTLSVQSHSGQTQMMNAYIRRFAKKVPNASVYEDNGNIYVTKGKSDTFPCLVSHTDTVHLLEDTFVVMKHDGIYFGWNGTEQCGVGGDDKVGVAMCLWFLQELPHIKVAFFRDEERGCLGSALADMQFFDDVEFVVQCDRNGDRDVVNSIMQVRLFDKEFEDVIADSMIKYGRRITTGLMTDVWKLRSKGLEVASMNLSCGYFKAHSAKEIVDEFTVIQTRDFISEMIETCAGKRWIVAKETRSPYALQGSTTALDKWKSAWDNAKKEDDHPEMDEDEYEKSGGLFDDLGSDEYCEKCGVRGSLIFDVDEDDFFCMACQEYTDNGTIDKKNMKAFLTY